MCKWSAVTRHPTGFTKYISIVEKSYFSMNSIHSNTCHEMIWWPLQSKWGPCQIIEILPHMPSELQLYPVKLKHKLVYKSHYMYDMIRRDHVISPITWLNEHNSYYADIKLNEHWYNDIDAKELSVQLDENDNCITVTYNAVLHQLLEMENTSKDKLNKEDNQQLFTKHIESTNVETIDTESDDEDTELFEEQVAVNCKQELTGDPLPSVVQLKTWRIKSINVHLGKITFPNIFY